MQEIDGVEVTDVLGWNTTSDGKHVVVAMKRPSGAAFGLAVTPQNLFDLARQMLAVVGQMQNQKGAAVQTASVFRPELFETGDIRGSNEVALTFYMPNEVALNFALPPAMLAHLAETLSEAAGHISIAPPPRSQIN